MGMVTRVGSGKELKCALVEPDYVLSAGYLHPCNSCACGPSLTKAIRRYVDIILLSLLLPSPHLLSIMSLDFY